MKNKRGNIAAALVLILLGAWFLSVQIFPGLRQFAYSQFSWPLVVIGVGLVFGLVGLLTWVPGLLIPACIVGGIGCLLYWQNATGNWGSWAYAWTLIPGFVGVGIFLSGLLSRDREAMIGGGWTIFISLTLLAVFGTFLGGLTLWAYWPVLLIVAGVLMLARGLFRR